MKTLICLALLTVSSLAPAAEVDKECVRGRLEQTFKGVINFYEKETPFVDCDKTNLSYRVRKAFYQLQNPGALVFASTTYHMELVGFDAFKFVQEGANQVFVGVHNSPGEWNYSGYSGWVKDYSGKDTAVYAITSDAKDLTDLEIRATLVHLAAHHHEKLANHTRCLRGPFATLNEAACDADWWSGSYAAEAEYLIGQAGSKALPADVRAEARTAAIERLIYHTNDAPSFLNIGAIVYPREGGVAFFDGKYLNPLVKNLPAGLEIANCVDNVTLVDAKKGVVFEHDFHAGLLSRGTPAALAAAGDRALYRDLFEIGDMTCWLFTNKITCQSKLRGGEIATRTFAPGLSRFAWVRTQEAGPRDNRHVIVPQILKEDGTALAMAGSFAEFKSNVDLQPSLSVPSSVPHEIDRLFFQKYAQFPYDILSLQENGTIFGHDPKKNVGSSFDVIEEVTELKGMKFRKITGPMLWSNRLDDI